jgi:hypothetical protein
LKCPTKSRPGWGGFFIFECPICYSFGLGFGYSENRQKLIGAAMKRWLLSVFLFCLSGMALAQVTQYSATVTPYASVNNFTAAPCPVGQSCVNFTTSMTQSGSFTVAAPLAPNLTSVDIHASVLSYSFSDGVNTYSSIDPSSRLYFF